MRFNQEEKYEIIKLVEESELGVSRTLAELGIHKSTFYNWYNKYLQQGYDGLAPKPRAQKSYWNRIPGQIRNLVLELALDTPELSPRELAHVIVDQHQYYISESSVYRILKAHGLIASPTHELTRAADSFKDQTTRCHQMWQTDFTYMKIIGWGWYYLSTVLDDYSRYIVHWELCSTMKAEDVTRTLENALYKASLTKQQKPKLLSDNGSCYISSELSDFLSEKGMDHVRGRPLHPQTQGKIERYHRSMKNVIKLENYYLPGQLECRLQEFIDYYNNHRYHESLQNLTPADLYYGRAEKILRKRALTKARTMNKRKKYHMHQMLNI